MRFLTVLSLAVLLVTWGLAAHAAEPGPAVSLNAADYPDLQAAVNALPNSGGTVLLPPGTIKLDKTLNLSFALHQNPQFSVTLQGAGTLATVLLLDTKGQPGLDFTGNSYWKVSNLHLMNRSGNVGVLLARTPANGRGCSGEFNNVLFSGCFPVAAVYLTGAEVCRFYHCQFSNQLKKWYNQDVAGVTEGEACVMISPNNVRGLQSPYCTEGTGGGSNTEYYFDGCTFNNEAPESRGLKIFGQASDIRVTNSYLHSDGFTAIYLDATKGNLSGLSLRDLRIEGEHGQHALYAIGHTNQVTIEGGSWNATKEVILQEAAPVAFVDAGGPCVSKVGAANKWRISQLSMSIWDGWGYSKEYRQMAQEMRGGPLPTAWADNVPHVYMRFHTLLNSVIEPCEPVTLRWREALARPANAGDQGTVNGLSAEQAQGLFEASFQPGEANQRLRDRMRQVALGAGSAGNRITVTSRGLLEIDAATARHNSLTILPK
ncbi:MAG TPA: right-handed parallel beta-helix repeat-containing protein [Armatimonadota bacterium]|jgi:hypothetical protein